MNFDMCSSDQATRIMAMVSMFQDAVLEHRNSYGHVDNRASARADLLEVVRRVSKNSERYCWLRATTNFVTGKDGRMEVRGNASLWDAAIDAAIDEAKAKATGSAA